VGDRVAFSPSFSPDMNKVYFTSNRSGSSDVWAQPLVEGRPQGPPQRRTDLPGGQAILAISPDGRWIAFHRNLENQRDIWIVPEAGGPAVNITNQAGMNIHPSWSPDSGRIAFSSDRDGHQHIWVVPVSGGQPAGPAQRITEGDALDLDPAWSPDGRRIAFHRASKGVSDVFIVPAEGGVPRRLTHDASPGDVEWEAPGDALLVIGSWGTDRMEIRRVLAEGGAPEPLDPPVITGDDSSMGDFCLSRDARYIAYTEERPRGNIWVLETEEGWR
jgi:Tol biopolymer transport system component